MISVHHHLVLFLVNFEFENIFKNRNFSRSCIKPAKGSPIIDDQPRANNITSPINSSCTQWNLQQITELIQFLKWVKITSTVAKGWTIPPLLLNWQNVPTSKFPAMVVLKTSTPSTSWIISSVSRSMSVCTRATWSLHAITFPRADKRSSTRFMRTVSGIELRRLRSSTSEVVAGTKSPFLFPKKIFNKIVVIWAILRIEGIRGFWEFTCG